MQDAAGLTGYKASEGPDYDNMTNLSTDSGGESRLEYDADVNLAKYYIHGLKTQVWTFVRHVGTTTNNWLSPHANTILGDWLAEFERGLRQYVPRKLKNDHTAATSLADLVTGFKWKDDSVGTNSMHWQHMRRFAYAFGLEYRKKYPILATRIDSASFTIRSRVNELIGSAAAGVFADLIPAMGVQSSRAVFNVGFALDLVTSEVTEMLGAVDPDIAEIFAKNKTNSFLMEFGATTQSNHEVYVEDYLNFDLLDGTTLEEAIKRLKKPYVGANWAVKVARRVFGIGTFSRGGEEIHFMNLVNTAVPTSSGAYDNHVTTQWDAGVSLKLCLEYFKDLTDNNYQHDMNEAFKKRKSYTWTDLESFADFATTIKVAGDGASFNGGAEAMVYPALRRHLPFSAFPSSGSAMMGGATPTTDFDNMVSNGAWKVGLALSTSSLVPYRAIWLLAFFPQNLVNEHRLYHSSFMSIEDLAVEMFIGMFFDNAGPNATKKYEYYGFHLVEFIEARTDSGKPKHRYDWVFATAEVLRFENVLDVLATSSGAIVYDTIAMKYAYGVAPSGISINPLLSLSRPKGLVGTSFHYMEDFGEPSNLIEILENAILIPPTSTSSSGSEKPKPKPKPKQENDDKPGLDVVEEEEETTPVE
jgi:hypothetical protein